MVSLDNINLLVIHLETDRPIAKDILIVNENQVLSLNSCSYI